MAEDVIELGLEGANFITERLHDKVYDKLPAHRSKSRRSSSADFGQDSDSGSSDHGGSRTRRNRGARGDELGERWYRTRGSIGDEDSDRRSRQGPDYGSQPGYGARDLEISYNQRSNDPPYQTAGYQPYAPTGSAMTYPSRPTSEGLRGTSNRRRRYYSQSPSPPPSRRRERRSSGTDIDMTSGVIGALAGGLVGSQLGQGGTLTTVVAAAIGAVGASQLEKRYEKHRKRERRKERKAG